MNSIWLKILHLTTSGVVQHQQSYERERPIPNSAVPDIQLASDSELPDLHSELADVDWDTLFESLDSHISNTETGQAPHSMMNRIYA